MNLVYFYPAVFPTQSFTQLIVGDAPSVGASTACGEVPAAFGAMAADAAFDQSGEVAAGAVAGRGGLEGGEGDVGQDHEAAEAAEHAGDLGAADRALENRSSAAAPRASPSWRASRRSAQSASSKSACQSISPKLRFCNPSHAIAQF